MIDLAACSLRPMTKDDLDQVRLWRNHPTIRRYMFHTADISPTQHATWFQAAKDDPRKHLFIFECHNEPTGFINVSQLGGAVMEWGFYKRPDAPRGIGHALGIVTLHHVFHQLDAHKLCGRVIAYNTASRHFHEKLGFKQEGILRQQHYDGTHYHDVYCYGLLKDHWQHQQRNNHDE